MHYFEGYSLAHDLGLKKFREINIRIYMKMIFKVWIYSAGFFFEKKKTFFREIDNKEIIGHYCIAKVST